MTTNEELLNPTNRDAYGFAALCIVMELDLGEMRLRQGRCFSCGAKAPVAYSHSRYRPTTRGRCLPCLHAFIANKYDEMPHGQG